MRTAFGHFAKWLTGKIPDLVRSEVKTAVSAIPKAKDGRDGKAGKSGVSVVDAEVAADGNLVLKLSDGKIIDAGELPKVGGANGQVFVSGNAWQITVSSTAPPNPQLNQLWYDTST